MLPLAGSFSGCALLIALGFFQKPAYAAKKLRPPEPCHAQVLAEAHNSDAENIAALAALRRPFVGQGNLWPELAAHIAAQADTAENRGRLRERLDWALSLLLERDAEHFRKYYGIGETHGATSTRDLAWAALVSDTTVLRWIANATRDLVALHRTIGLFSLSQDLSGLIHQKGPAGVPVRLLGLDDAVVRKLMAEKILTVGQLTAMTEEDLFLVGRLGPAGVSAILDKLAENGHSLRPHRLEFSELCAVAPEELWGESFSPILLPTQTQTRNFLKRNLQRFPSLRSLRDGLDELRSLPGCGAIGEAEIRDLIERLERAVPIPRTSN